MLVLIAMAIMAAQRPLPPSEIKACLGVKEAYADWTAIAEAKASLPADAWQDACRQARDANARRLSAVKALMVKGASPVAGYQNTTAYISRARKAKDPIVADLFRFAAADQAARESLAKGPLNAGLSPLALRLYRAVVAVDAVEADRRSRAWLKQVVSQRGWFTISRDGAEADEAAQRIVQHADEDVAFKGEMIALIEPLVESGESRRSFFPAMYDRWAAEAGKPLRFGFQGSCKSKGVWEPLPVEDPDHIDERRARFGITQSFADEVKENGARCA